MDGGGRLDRSPGSPRPHSDLKWAAIGAAMLLRERLAVLMRPRVKRRVAREQNPPRLIITLERYLPRRAGVVATALVLIGSVGLGVVKGGHVDELIATLSDTRNAAANTFGFRIASVTINGRKQLSQDEILAVGGVNGRSSLLFL